MRKNVIVMTSVILLVGAYAAWPFIGLYQLGDALHARDADAALERIDVVSVRRSIAAQILNEGIKGTGAEQRLAEIEGRLGDIGGQFAANVGLSVVDGQLAQFITPETLRQLIAQGEIPAEIAERIPVEARPEAAAADAQAWAVGLPENPLRYIQDWELRSPTRIRTVIGEDGQPEHWTGLTLALRGPTWELSRIELPESIISGIRPAFADGLQKARL